MEKDICASFIVGVDIRDEGKTATLVVGVQDNRKVIVSNVITGEEALKLYHQLTNKRDEKKDENS